MDQASIKSKGQKKFKFKFTRSFFRVLFSFCLSLKKLTPEELAQAGLLYKRAVGKRIIKSPVLIQKLLNAGLYKPFLSRDVGNSVSVEVVATFFAEKAPTQSKSFAHKKETLFTWCQRDIALTRYVLSQKEWKTWITQKELRKLLDNHHELKKWMQTREDLAARKKANDAATLNHDKPTRPSTVKALPLDVPALPQSPAIEATISEAQPLPPGIPTPPPPPVVGATISKPEVLSHETSTPIQFLADVLGAPPQTTEILTATSILYNAVDELPASPQTATIVASHTIAAEPLQTEEEIVQTELPTEATISEIQSLSSEIPASSQVPADELSISSEIATIAASHTITAEPLPTEEEIIQAELPVEATISEIQPLSPEIPTSSQVSTDELPISSEIATIAVSHTIAAEPLPTEEEIIQTELPAEATIFEIQSLSSEIPASSQVPTDELSISSETATIAASHTAVVLYQRAAEQTDQLIIAPRRESTAFSEIFEQNTRDLNQIAEALEQNSRQFDQEINQIREDLCRTAERGEEDARRFEEQMSDLREEWRRATEQMTDVKEEVRHAVEETERASRATEERKEKVMLLALEQMASAFGKDECDSAGQMAGLNQDARRVLEQMTQQMAASIRANREQEAQLPATEIEPSQHSHNADPELNNFSVLSTASVNQDSQSSTTVEAELLHRSNNNATPHFNHLTIEAPIPELQFLSPEAVPVTEPAAIEITTSEIQPLSPEIPVLSQFPADELLIPTQTETINMSHTAVVLYQSAAEQTDQLIIAPRREITGFNEIFEQNARDLNQIAEAVERNKHEIAQVKEQMAVRLKEEEYRAAQMVEEARRIVEEMTGFGEKARRITDQMAGFKGEEMRRAIEQMASVLRKDARGSDEQMAGLSQDTCRAIEQMADSFIKDARSPTKRPDQCLDQLLQFTQQMAVLMRANRGQEPQLPATEVKPSQHSHNAASDAVSVNQDSQSSTTVEAELLHRSNNNATPHFNHSRNAHNSSNKNSRKTSAQNDTALRVSDKGKAKNLDSADDVSLDAALKYQRQ